MTPVQILMQQCEGRENIQIQQAQSSLSDAPFLYLGVDFTNNRF